VGLSALSEKESSLLKKRSKQLLLFAFTGDPTRLPRRVSEQAKVFWFFFSKKNIFLMPVCSDG
jgi:hypothetical protein